MAFLNFLLFTFFRDIVTDYWTLVFSNHYAFKVAIIVIHSYIVWINTLLAFIQMEKSSDLSRKMLMMVISILMEG